MHTNGNGALPAALHPAKLDDDDDGDGDGALPVKVDAVVAPLPPVVVVFARFLLCGGPPLLEGNCPLTAGEAPEGHLQD